MNAILEADNSTMTAVSERSEPIPPVASLRQFALRQIGTRLAVEPELVASFWNQLGSSADKPDLTVVYCSLRCYGRNFALLEFVAGETLEDLVKRSDPASCEREIPLLCGILDAFEDPAKHATGTLFPAAGFELLDFGVGRANAALTSKRHGAVVTGPDGTESDEVFGEYGGSRSQAMAALMELCSKLPGHLPRTEVYGPAHLSGVTVSSLSAPTAAPAPPPVQTVAPAPVSRRTVHPYLITAGTALSILVVLYGVGGFLAKRIGPQDAGKLILPPIAAPAQPVPVEAAPVEIPIAVTAVKTKRGGKGRSAKQPVTSIVLTRGARPIVQTSLAYPPEAQKEHVSGVVEMQFTIAEDGSVQSPHVVSGDPLLRAGLAEEVSKWVYQPLKVNGKPVPMNTEMAIRFNLN